MPLDRSSDQVADPYRKVRLPFWFIVALSVFGALYAAWNFGEVVRKPDGEPYIEQLMIVWLLGVGVVRVWRFATTPWKNVFLVLLMADLAYDVRRNIFIEAITYYDLRYVLVSCFWVLALMVLYYHRPEQSHVPPMEEMPREVKPQE